MRIAALDISKTSCGYACWGLGDDGVLSGAWELGSSFTPDGDVFCRLHEKLTWLHEQRPIDAIFMEETLDPRVLSGHTNIKSLKLLTGLNSHAQSWGAAMDCHLVMEINQARWRREFLGPIKRGTKSPDIKELSMSRCRQLGFKPVKHDEAEAIGLLTYALLSMKITPSWIQDEVLREPL